MERVTGELKNPGTTKEATGRPSTAPELLLLLMYIMNTKANSTGFVARKTIQVKGGTLPPRRLSFLLCLQVKFAIEQANPEGE
jgi:hypothetical protein